MDTQAPVSCTGKEDSAGATCSTTLDPQNPLNATIRPESPQPDNDSCELSLRAVLAGNDLLRHNNLIGIRLDDLVMQAIKSQFKPV